MTPFDENDDRKYNWSQWRGVVDTRLANIEQALVRIEGALTKRQDEDSMRVEELEKKVNDLEIRVTTLKRYAWVLMAVAGLAGAFLERLFLLLAGR